MTYKKSIDFLNTPQPHFFIMEIHTQKKHSFLLTICIDPNKHLYLLINIIVTTPDGTRFFLHLF
jgi:hypothetical protein